MYICNIYIQECTMIYNYNNYIYMKIHVPSMLAIGVDKHTQQETSSHNGFIKIRAATLA